MSVEARFSHTLIPNTESVSDILLKVIKQDPTATELANEALIDAKALFQGHFTTRKDVRNSIIHPTLPDGVTVKWLN